MSGILDWYKDYHSHGNRVDFIFAITFAQTFLLLSQDKVLKRIIGALQQFKHPRRRHRDSERADKERHHQHDNPIRDRSGKQDQHAENAKNRSGEAEDERGTVQQTGANPHEQCEHYDDGRDEYF